MSKNYRFSIIDINKYKKFIYCNHPETHIHMRIHTNESLNSMYIRMHIIKQINLM
jgi:hypothetical protein